MDDFEREIKEDFLSEARDLLQEAEGVFLKLEDNPQDDEILNQIFRLAHNLKGTSKAVGFDDIADFTHSAESLILKIQNGEIVATKPIVSVLLEFKDTVDVAVSLLEMDLNSKFDCTEIKSKLEAAMGQTQQLESQPEAEAEAEAKVETIEIEQVVLDVTIEEPVKAEPIVQAATESPKPQAKVQKPKATPAQGAENEDIRVKLSRIDKVNDYIGELVILQTALDQRRGIYIEDEQANHAISQMSKISRELQELAMSLRMIPLTNTFQKMRRIVRDTSDLLGKEVELEVVGGETEVDKKVLESLSDPLVHIVRNAVDHGIENPEKRAQSGKPEAGKVEIMALHEGGKLIILITDDGGGINAEVLRKKAIERKIISENDIIPDQQMIQYIFHPGFSTKEQVTEVSGRGVGMDVVKTNIEKLGGEVKVMTKLGEGSCFRIELPLTLAIVDGLIISVAQQRYALPLNQVQEIINLDVSEIVFMTKGGEFLKHRTKVIPLFRLHQKLNLKHSDEDKSKKFLTVIIVKGTAGHYGVVIDDVMNKQQIVIKTLGQDFKDRDSFMGGTILGDGKPALIVDFIETFRHDYKVKIKAHSVNHEAA